MTAKKCLEVMRKGLKSVGMTREGGWGERLEPLSRRNDVAPKDARLRISCSRRSQGFSISRSLVVLTQMEGDCTCPQVFLTASYRGNHLYTKGHASRLLQPIHSEW